MYVQWSVLTVSQIQLIMDKNLQATFDQCIELECYSVHALSIGFFQRILPSHTSLASAILIAHLLDATKTVYHFIFSLLTQSSATL